MLLVPCHVEGTRVLHLSHTALVVEALCGIEADAHEAPDLAVICEECLEHALFLGADVGAFVEIALPQRLPLAA